MAAATTSAERPSGSAGRRRAALFFFSSRRRHTRDWRDWSSDVCSSDLDEGRPAEVPQRGGVGLHRQAGRHRPVAGAGAGVDQPGPERAAGREAQTGGKGRVNRMNLQRRTTKDDRARRRAASKARILVVDDDERNLLALTEVLKDLAQVIQATSGQEALRHLLKGDFAVILLDVFMPGMDGYETAALIRAREQTARIPIIFLSAVNKETEHLMRGYSMGAVDYVFKPVDPLVLKSKVSVFVDLYNMRMQVAEKSRAEHELREANYQAELDRLQIARELQAT